MDLTADSFKTEVASKGRVLVEFYGDWCRDCQAVAPVLREIAEEISDTIKVARIDVQAHPDKAQEYGVKHIPHFILFEDGAKIREAFEITTREAVESFLEGS
jgi:thioredoxin 1